MARHKKPGKRDTGIQSKKGYLYFITNQKVFDGESMITKKKWISTGLKDTPENLKKAIEMHDINAKIKMYKNYQIKMYKL